MPFDSRQYHSENGVHLPPRPVGGGERRMGECEAPWPARPWSLGVGTRGKLTLTSPRCGPSALYLWSNLIPMILLNRDNRLSFHFTNGKTTGLKVTWLRLQSLDWKYVLLQKPSHTPVNSVLVFPVPVSSEPFSKVGHQRLDFHMWVLVQAVPASGWASTDWPLYHSELVFNNRIRMMVIVTGSNKTIRHCCSSSSWSWCWCWAPGAARGLTLVRGRLAGAGFVIYKVPDVNKAILSDYYNLAEMWGSSLFSE